VAFADSWIKDAASGCAIWNPNPAEHETIVWIGPIEDGKADGYGIATWRTRGKRTETALGQWRGGKLHGYGVWRHTSGAKYEGQWDAGMKHGFGIYTWTDGTSFVGEYLNDSRSHGRAFSADDEPLKSVATPQARAAYFAAEDAAIQARKSATRARVENPVPEKKNRALAKKRKSGAKKPKPAPKKNKAKAQKQVPAEQPPAEQSPAEDPSAK